jgi:hypothetical protein
MLPRRDGSEGILSDGQNIMSLKEQESVNITFEFLVAMNIIKKLWRKIPN